MNHSPNPQKPPQPSIISHLVKKVKHFPLKSPKSPKISKKSPQKLPKTLKILAQFFLLPLIILLSSHFLTALLLTSFIKPPAPINLSPALTLCLYLALSNSLTLLFLLKILPKFPQSSSAFHTTREQLGLFGLPTWTDLLMAPLALIASLLLAVIFMALASLLPSFNPAEPQNLGLTELLTPTERLFGFLAFAILAPVAEELIFRGWIYAKLRAHFRLVPSLLLTSLAFALVHGQLNVGVAVFAMSLIACLLRESTGTIYAPILLHFLKNSLAFYLLFIATTPL